MSQARTDRVVVGGWRATAGGRHEALRARGYVDVLVAYRQLRVLQLYRTGLTFREIAGRCGISKSQAHRDYWGLLMAKPGGRGGVGR